MRNNMRKNICICWVLVLLAGSLYCQDKERDIITLILDKYSQSNRDMTLLKRVNMGIPGGDNWLVEWTYKDTIGGIFINVYIINNDSIIHEITLGPSSDTSRYTDFDIMKDIPGTRIGEGSCVIYDYNGDGFDEIFRFLFGGSGDFVLITGYDPEKERAEQYARIPFEIIDRERGPAPAEFITYKGMKGFKVYLAEFEVAGGPGWVPNPNLRNGVWIFYSWDAEQRRYVEIEEVEEEGIESAWPVIIEQEVVEWKWKPGEQQAAELLPEEISSHTPVASGKNTRSNLYIVIIAAVALAAAVFIVVRRKGK